MSAIQRELEALQGADGLIRAEEVVEWAAAHPDSALHGQFEWDDAAAAIEHRVWQARRLIALHIVTETGERKTISLTVDRTKGGGYRAVEDVARIPELREVMLRDALGELKRTRARYRHLQELARVFEEIDRVAAAAPAEAAA